LIFIFITLLSELKKFCLKSIPQKKTILKLVLTSLVMAKTWKQMINLYFIKITKLRLPKLPNCANKMKVTILKHGQLKLSLHRLLQICFAVVACSLTAQPQLKKINPAR
jgi:hypothetical protein